MNRSLLAAPAVAAVLLTCLTGIATAQDDEPRSCTVVESELATAEAAAELPVTIDGVTYPTLGAVETALAGLPAIEAVEPLRTNLQAIVAAAAQVTVLRQEQTTCTEPSDEPTPTPTPSEEPEPTPTPVPNDPEQPLYANCAEARAFGAAPIAEGDPGYRPGLDSDGDGTACEVDEPDTTDTTDTTDSTGGDATLGGSDSSNSGIVDAIPFGSIDTGYVA